MMELKCVCPSCITEIYPGECRIVSGGPTRQELKPAPKGRKARLWAEPLDGPFYTLQLAHRECTQCGYLLPPNIERVPSIPLVVVGDTFSGKSQYIAAFIHQLKTEWLSNSTSFARFICLTPDVEQTYIEDYFDRLFTKKQSLAATIPAPNPTHLSPLIYKLVVSPSPKHPTTTTNLMIYDVAGEHYATYQLIIQFARFVVSSTSFIFVIDPFTMASVFPHLPAHLQANFQRSVPSHQGRRAVDSLHTTMSTYENFHKQRAGAGFPNTPIAIMVSKSDLFKSLVYPNTYHFMSNPSHGNGINLRDIEIVNNEVHLLLQQCQQHDLLAATDRFKRVQYFATSSTGEPPDANGEFNNVAPCRCLDPVLWILYQLGVIKEIL